MFYIVTGGSASGKSEYAESLAISSDARQRFHKDSTVLLECLSNLTANIFYDPIYADKDLAQMITKDILDLKKRVKDLIMVTNEIFSDGITYDPETTCYMQILGQVNQNLAREADRVIEVVYGIPVEIKMPGVKMS